MTTQFERIVEEILPTTLKRFETKAAEYGDEAPNVLGIRGQYSDMHRKMAKLRRAMWEGELLTSEPLEEVLDDLIAHCLLTLDMIHQQSRTDAGLYQCPWSRGDHVGSLEEFEKLRCILREGDHDEHVNSLGDVWPARDI
jgi:hypothetical protein